MNYLKTTFTFVTNNSTTDEKRDRYAENWERIFRKKESPTPPEPWDEILESLEKKYKEPIIVDFNEEEKCSTTKPKTKKTSKKNP